MNTPPPSEKGTSSRYKISIYIPKQNSRTQFSPNVATAERGTDHRTMEDKPYLLRCMADQSGFSDKLVKAQLHQNSSSVGDAKQKMRKKMKELVDALESTATA